MSYRRVQKESDELLWTRFWSLVMVREPVASALRLKKQAEVWRYKYFINWKIEVDRWSQFSIEMSVPFVCYQSKLSSKCEPLVNLLRWNDVPRDIFSVFKHI